MSDPSRVNPPMAQVKEFYAPAANTVPSPAVQSEEIRTPVSSYQPPESRYNGPRVFIQPVPGVGASENGAAVHPPTVAGRGGESATRKWGKRLCGIKFWAILTIIVGLLLIGLCIGLGVGLSRARRSSSASNASRHSTSTHTAPSTSTGLFAPPATTGVGFSFGSDQNTATVGLAASPGGPATGSITVTSASSAGPGGSVQTAPVFYSSAFNPTSFVENITYTVAGNGAKMGLGVVDCPASNNTRYVAAGGAVFQKLCYADVADAPNFDTAVVNSLDACIDACVANAASAAANNRGVSVPTCYAVAYGANITLGYAGQGANCWFKSRTGFPSAGDWQQSTAKLVGWQAEE